MKGFIQHLEMKRARSGPAPRFAQEDAARALLLLGSRKSRQALARELCVGEGTVRSILSCLKKQGFLDVLPSGTKRSVKGEEAALSLSQKIVCAKTTHASRLSFSLPCFCIQLRGVSAKNTLVLRDEMVRSGARGGTVYSFIEGRLIMPPFFARTHEEYARELSRLEKQFVFLEGDFLLACFDEARVKRERGAWRAAAFLGI